MTNLNLDRILIDAVCSGSISTTESLLREGANPNTKTSDGFPILAIASGLGRTSIVELLLSAGADPNLLESRKGNAPLHWAAQAGAIPAAELLLGRGAFIDQQNPRQGHTPLIEAVLYKRPEMVGFLLDRNARLDLATHYRMTPKDLVVGVLLKENDRLGEPNVDLGRAQLILELIEAREQQDLEYFNGHELTKAIFLHVVASFSGQTPDLAALETQVRELLSTPGVDLNAKTLLNGGKDPNNSDPNQPSFPLDGHTPLLLAAVGGLDSIVEMLLAAGADPNIPDTLYRAYPIHKATYAGHPGVTKILIEANVDLDVQGPMNGYTPLIDGLWRGNPDTAEIAIDAGADLSVKGHNGMTALALAIYEYGADHPIVAKIKAALAAGEG